MITEFPLRCTVGLLLRELEEGDRLALIELMDMKVEEIGHIAILDKLLKRDIRISISALTRHRARQTARGCQCPK